MATDTEGTLKEIEEKYISVPDIAREIGRQPYEVWNWIKARRLMETHPIVGRPLVLREDFARFKTEHPDLAKPREAQKMAA